MPITVGDTVPTHPAQDTIMPYLPLEVPYLNCRVLGLSNTALKWEVPSEGHKADVVGAMNGLNVPAPFRDTNFGKTGFPFQLPMNRLLCVWGEHSAVQMTTEIDYNEGISAPNTVYAPMVTDTRMWNYDSTVEFNMNTGDPPDDFSVPYGGGVPQQLHIKLQAVFNPGACDVSVFGEATLLSTDWDYMTFPTLPGGIPVLTQSAYLTCAEFHGGGATLTFSWVYVKLDPLGSPIGLVRAITVRIKGSTIYSG